MKSGTNRTSTLVYAAPLLFVALGIYLFVHSYPLRAFDQERLIYDLIWLDAWSLAFVVTIVILWRARLRRGWRIFSLVAALSAYSVVLTAVMFDGTVFGFNAYWGDQQFRIAQVLHFMAFGWDTDFFYKNLPPFYPPVYYFFLSLYAKLFSVEAYKMMKIGLMLLSLVTPAGVYLLWRKLVAPSQALLIAFAAVLFTGGRLPFVFYGAHQYVGNMLFFPWWLYFIERVRNSETKWSFYLVGGLLGAVIFSTYFYAFFIGGFLILMRVTLFRRWSFISDYSKFRFKSALIVLAAAAIFSAPYWLPLFISIARFGMDRSRGGWYTMDTPGVSFEYMALSWVGVIFLAGLVYSARHYRVPLHRGLLMLVGSVTLFFLAGSISGALDISVNLTKARDFIILAGVPVVGLFAAAVIRWSAASGSRRYAIAVILIAMLTLRANDMAASLRDKMVQVARTEAVPTFGTDPAEMAAAKGSVFLTAVLPVCSFYPVYAFIANNEHYSHPASRFKERYDLLNLLQQVPDPYLFYVALRHNIFDRVGYFMPSVNDGRYEIPINISNYPSMWTSKMLSFSQSVTGDTSLYIRRQGRNLFQLREPATERGVWRPELPYASAIDSLVYLERAKDIASYLQPAGKKLVMDYLGSDFTAFHALRIPDGGHVYADSIAMLGADAIGVGDSVLLVFRFEARENIGGSYRISLHLFPPDGSRINLDFSPQIQTDNWGKWDIVYCHAMTPRQEQPTPLELGFFRGERKLEPVYRGQIPGGL